MWYEYKDVLINLDRASSIELSNAGRGITIKQECKIFYLEFESEQECTEAWLGIKDALSEPVFYWDADGNR